MRALSRNKYSIIARLDRAIQYAAAVVFLTAAGVYWMPPSRA